MLRLENEGGGRAAARPTIILIREGWVQSWLRDASTFVLFIALIGIGVLLQSTAMQWVGALIGFLHIAGRARQLYKTNSFTIPEARAKLDELEAAR